MLQRIASAANPLIKDVRRAIARGGLTRDGWWVAETPHLLEEALRSGLDAHAVLVAESALDEVRSLIEGLRTVLLPDALFQTVAATETPQGVIALVSPPVWTMDDLFLGRALIVVLDELQDPGNAGAVVRAAEAFGATGVMFLKGTASPHNPKTLRASAGSLFRVPVAHGLELPCAWEALVERSAQIFAAVPPRAGSIAIDAADFTVDCGIVIGNEARGVSTAWRERQGCREVTICTAGVESLNAAVAAGILLYEVRRQRNLR